MARVKPACGCGVFNGSIIGPCLMHIRWHRQRAQPLRTLLREAVPDNKTDPHDWAARRDREFKIIDTE